MKKVEMYSRYFFFNINKNINFEIVTTPLNM